MTSSGLDLQLETRRLENTKTKLVQESVADKSARCAEKFCPTDEVRCYNNTKVGELDLSDGSLPFHRRTNG